MISDRQAALEKSDSDLRDYLDGLGELKSFIGEQGDAVASLGLPLSKDDAQQMAKKCRALAEETNQRRPALEKLRGKCHELTRLQSEEKVPGVGELKKGQAQVETAWDALQDSLKSAQQRAVDSKELHGTREQLDKWLEVIAFCCVYFVPRR